jgi:hypothetical protein
MVLGLVMVVFVSVLMMKVGVGGRSGVMCLLVVVVVMVVEVVVVVVAILVVMLSQGHVVVLFVSMVVSIECLVMLCVPFVL